MSKKTSRNGSRDNPRIEILKTYKLFVGGKFPRSESGRYYVPSVKGTRLGNVCRASRKDLREAVVSARSAQPGWASRSAYNRGQILYRVGEMLQGRAEQFISELTTQGLSAKQARAEVALSIDRLVYYAGWTDKYQQIFSAVNPVASSHFNFSILEPTGVVFHVASDENPLLGLVSLLAPIIASGNSVISLASQSKPLSAITFSEVLATSDLPGGVVNILTGHVGELAEHFSQHLDINAIALNRDDRKLVKTIEENAAGNLKRVRQFDQDWAKPDAQNPYLIRDFCEVKTTWHPIEQISASGSGY